MKAKNVTNVQLDVWDANLWTDIAYQLAFPVESVL